MPRLKPQAKFVLIVVAGLGVVFGLRAAMQHGLIPTPGIMKSIVASRVTLPPQEEAQVANVQALPYPSTAPANVQATHIQFDVWEWNAMYALISANVPLFPAVARIIHVVALLLVLQGALQINAWIVLPIAAYLVLSWRSARRRYRVYA